ncbi:MAG TPA: GDP-mannose 4,6-dehydratase [Alphaproteobacteria bacterium]|nr:GDP-mannose 4,6-dehydratase [Alphaproteobacteria bacterium]
MAKRLLVTGGAGFIGSNFCHYVYDKYPDWQIDVLDILTYAGNTANLPEEATRHSGRIRLWIGDVTNANLVDNLVSKADTVVHFAAETHVTRSIFDNLNFFETDVIGTHIVANAILKAQDRIERFIHVSTSEVYGTARAETMDEDHPLMPMSPYASAKCGADRLVYSYWETYRIPAIIVRPFNNYGPRQHLEKVVPRFISSALLDEPFTVHGVGQAERDFIHVDDTCRALDLLLAAPRTKVIGEVFNIASGEARSVLSIAEQVAELSERPRDSIVFIGERPGQVVRHIGDYGRIERLLGWRPEIRWKDGLKATYRWYRDNRDHWRPQLWMRQIPVRTQSGVVELH